MRRSEGGVMNQSRPLIFYLVFDRLRQRAARRPRGGRSITTHRHYHRSTRKQRYRRKWWWASNSLTDEFQPSFDVSVALVSHSQIPCIPPTPCQHCTTVRLHQTASGSRSGAACFYSFKDALPCPVLPPSLMVIHAVV